ncbi:M23 family metallopeptidase [Cryobacterium sp. 1639]|uniref:murein hydrolase activator EnvC family protein n=1 Tax=Cryobacterium inferilacus TaxID=2866629 RepID=UPI001C72BB4C|nr:M23 family metallopeptidase [Cryobacterium sp. 1639]MBX0298647.1 M23 family metallopeptidase [Cryobacterium sp. 1639]
MGITVLLCAVLLGVTSAAGGAATPEAAVAAAPAAVEARPAALWQWPVGGPQNLQRSFEAPLSRYGTGHRGIDLVAGPGAPVRAPADGVVSFSGVVVDRPVLSLQHGEDLVSSFEPVAATVSVGDRVAAGQVIGVVASGAHCAERCVHFGVRRHGQYISPILFLGGLARAVLLPVPPAGPVR